MPVVVEGGGGRKTTYAMLDDGSTTTVISEGLAKELALEAKMTNTTLHTVDGVSNKVRSLVDFKVRNVEGDVSLTISQALVSDFLTTEEDKPPKNEEVEGVEHLQGVQFHQLETEDVDIILSVDHSWTWL